MCVSGLFSGPAIERITKSELEAVVVCNTVPLPPHKQVDKIHQLSIAAMLAQVHGLCLVDEAVDC